MELVPVTFQQVRRFVHQHHRHSSPPVVARFSVGLEVDGALVGVAVAGLPSARLLCDGRTIEVPHPMAPRPISTMADERERMLDCLAAWCMAHPERGRVLWSHWSDPSHRNARAPEWLADMRERFARLKSGV